MLVGTSLSRCVVDIFEKRVNMSDIMVIVARTSFDPKNDKHWAGIWDGYLHGGFSNPEWRGYDDKEAEFRQICIDLVDKGLLHQPRLFGAHPQRTNHVWLETTLPDHAISANPAVAAAWNDFKVMAELVGPNGQ